VIAKQLEYDPDKYFQVKDCYVGRNWLKKHLKNKTENAASNAFPKY